MAGTPTNPVGPNDANKVVDWLDDANAILTRVNPLLGMLFASAKIVYDLIKHPDTDPALRRQLIAQMRAGAQDMQAISNDWLAQHGFDHEGNRLPSHPPPLNP